MASPSKSREQKTVSKDTETVVSNSPDEEIHERIETNKTNTFSNSGERKSEEERTSKGQEGREINPEPAAEEAGRGGSG